MGPWRCRAPAFQRGTTEWPQPAWERDASMLFHVEAISILFPQLRKELAIVADYGTRNRQRLFEHRKYAGIWVFVSVQWRYANSLAALGDSVFGVEKDAVMVVAWRHRLGE
jgi:hypothetical protein